MEIKHDLLPTQKSRSHNLKAAIDIYPIATELYEELNKIEIIERMKAIPQLGVIKVKKKLNKSRYDYVMLQLYLHQLIKNNIQTSLKLTYNNYIKEKEFNKDVPCINKNFKPSLGDIMQIISIVYNIGHFYNTFTASRAVTMMASQDITFKNMVLKASDDTNYQTAVNNLLVDKNYQRFHLTNSLLILEHCNPDLSSVKLAKELLYAYLNETNLPEDSKLRYAFDVFRKVRTLSYMAYDLQIANTPITIDIANQEAINALLKEWLSEYNNSISSNHLVDSISKLLDDTVYNENSNAICYYKISRKIVSKLEAVPSFENADYYSDFFIDKDNLLNANYPHRRDYAETQILKLTFAYEDRNISSYLLEDLERLNNTRVGYYDRHSGEQTIVVSIKDSCDYNQKVLAALKVVKTTVSAIRKVNGISPCDSKFILCTKFLLFYLFKENPVIIKPTLDDKKCVFCTRGKNSRIKEINTLLKEYTGSDDQKHETNFMMDILNVDTINDTSITIPASILVYEKDAVGRKLCELDGMIIHPMRNKEQIIFLEAKNTTNKPAYGKKCLKEKFDTLQIAYNPESIGAMKKSL
jgi:hypothetical protein